jgi:Flp pilus assembly pilin Flp
MCRAAIAGDAVRESERRRGHADQQGRATGVAALRFAQGYENESGQTMAEYAVVLGAITLLVVGAISLLSANIATQVARIASYINFS